MTENILHTYKVQKEGVSDDGYELKSIHAIDGEFVNKGQALLDYETSKTIVEIIAEESGYFYTNQKEGNIITVGEVIAFITKNKVEEPTLFFKKENQQNSETSKAETEIAVSSKLTESARTLLKDIEKLPGELKGDDFITKADLIKAITSRLFHMPLPQRHIERVVFIGAGGMIETAIQAARLQGYYHIVGILDSNNDIGTEFLGVPVIGQEDDYQKLLNNNVKKMMITFAGANDRRARQKTFERFLSYGFEAVNIIHPQAFVDPSAKLGKGNLILEGARIGSECIVGDNNYINVNSILCHHAVLKDNIHLAPNSTIAGNVIIEKHCLIGMASTTVSGIKISENSVINNGVNLIMDTKPNSVIKK